MAIVEHPVRDDDIRTLLTESWRQSWPMTLIMLFEFCIGLADVYVAGRLGSNVQAAYGLAFQLYFVFITIAIALSVGTVAVVSRFFTAAGQKGELGSAIATSMIAAVVSGIVFGALGIVFARPLVAAISAPPATRELAGSLLQIYAVAFLFDYLLLASNGVLRSCGMPRRALVTMTIVCALNIVLNFALGLGTPLGYCGIGWATVISLAAGAAANAGPIIRLVGGAWRFSGAMLKRFVEIGWPSAALQVVWQLGAVALFAAIGMLPGRAVEAMAALTNGLKIESALFLPAFAFNMANAVVVGNLLGKGGLERAFRGGLVTAGLGAVIVTAATIGIYLFRGAIAGALAPDGAIAAETARYLSIALIFEPLMAVAVILGGALNGAGDTKGVMVITAVVVWGIRIPLVYVLGIFFGLGPAAIWWGMNAPLAVQALLIWRRYSARRWTTVAEPAA